jgi:hypothetical protein
MLLGFPTIRRVAGRIIKHKLANAVRNVQRIT